ncbi:tetratricopeptide repeat protein [Aliifodinibius sp. S!AR15-10]|uniref:tetratricopeptide repeat protein n=1 Tax=Aliifodinibius sp. S!AR15-10 TaxID=2950437 RepID=UPI00285D90E0|nr:tetratricopeptide repeat protein [Aliifodinibius sp. S!AR15-10]MDR8392867.1 tetratricopeptide repeat protein [Aliifodinibius sp. S!AR15-10]
MSFEETLEEGLASLREGDFDEALDIAHSLQKMEPQAADGFHLEAMTFQKLNQWEPSIEALDKAIKLEPEKSGYYNLRGFAQLQLEQLADAEDDFKKAIDLDDSPAAHRNLVLHKIMNDQGNEAISYLLDRIRNNPKDVENWILMGDLMQRAGQGEKARSYYEQAKKMDPENEYVQGQLDEL